MCEVLLRFINIRFSMDNNKNKRKKKENRAVRFKNYNNKIKQMKRQIQIEES